MQIRRVVIVGFVTAMVSAVVLAQGARREGERPFEGLSNDDVLVGGNELVGQQLQRPQPTSAMTTLPTFAPQQPINASRTSPQYRAGSDTRDPVYRPGPSQSPAYAPGPGYVASTPPPTAAGAAGGVARESGGSFSCGSAARIYDADETAYSGVLCEANSPNTTVVLNTNMADKPFPDYGQYARWSCSAFNNQTGARTGTITCEMYRSTPTPTPIPSPTP